jgi:hypothetical protein
VGSLAGEKQLKMGERGGDLVAREREKAKGKKKWGRKKKGEKKGEGGLCAGQ